MSYLSAGSPTTTHRNLTSNSLSDFSDKPEKDQVICLRLSVLLHRNCTVLCNFSGLWTQSSIMKSHVSGCVCIRELVRLTYWQIKALALCQLCATKAHCPFFVVWVSIIYTCSFSHCHYSLLSKLALQCRDPPHIYIYRTMSRYTGCRWTITHHSS